MVDLALNSILIDEIFQDMGATNHPNSSQSENFVRHIAGLHTNIVSNEFDPEVSSDDTVLNTVRDLLEMKINSITCNKTAKLWLQYSEMVFILRKFIMAERIGDWDLHLQMLQEMLPFLASAGHNHYAKSLVLYLDKMSKLCETHPEVYAAFKKGLHPVRRSDREWAGLSTDLVIEQELMRSLKTSGGLTRGSRMSESQRAIWVM